MTSMGKIHELDCDCSECKTAWAALKPGPVTTTRYYHATTRQGADGILAGGFVAPNPPVSLGGIPGVFISDSPVDQNEGAKGAVLLAVDFEELPLWLAQFEVVEEGKPEGVCREWAVHPQLLNILADVTEVKREDALLAASLAEDEDDGDLFEEAGDPAAVHGLVVHRYWGAGMRSPEFGPIQLPEGWDFLPTEDLSVIRQVKKGPHWVLKGQFTRACFMTRS